MHNSIMQQYSIIKIFNKNFFFTNIENYNIIKNHQSSKSIDIYISELESKLDIKNYNSELFIPEKLTNQIVGTMLDYMIFLSKNVNIIEIKYPHYFNSFKNITVHKLYHNNQVIYKYKEFNSKENINILSYDFLDLPIEVVKASTDIQIQLFDSGVFVYVNLNFKENINSEDIVIQFSKYNPFSGYSINFPLNFILNLQFKTKLKIVNTLSIINVLMCMFIGLTNSLNYITFIFSVESTNKTYYTNILYIVFSYLAISSFRKHINQIFIIEANYILNHNNLKQIMHNYTNQKINKIVDKNINYLKFKTNNNNLYKNDINNLAQQLINMLDNISDLFGDKISNPYYSFNGYVKSQIMFFDSFKKYKFHVFESDLQTLYSGENIKHILLFDETKVNINSILHLEYPGYIMDDSEKGIIDMPPIQINPMTDFLFLTRTLYYYKPNISILGSIKSKRGINSTSSKSIPNENKVIYNNYIQDTLIKYIIILYSNFDISFLTFINTAYNVNYLFSNCIKKDNNFIVKNKWVSYPVKKIHIKINANPYQDYSLEINNDIFEYLSKNILSIKYWFPIQIFIKNPDNKISNKDNNNVNITIQKNILKTFYEQEGIYYIILAFLIFLMFIGIKFTGTLKEFINPIPNVRYFQVFYHIKMMISNLFNVLMISETNKLLNHICISMKLNGLEVIITNFLLFLIELFDLLVKVLNTIADITELEKFTKKIKKLLEPINISIPNCFVIKILNNDKNGFQINIT